jgi:hypothetical protein
MMKYGKNLAQRLSIKKGRQIFYEYLAGGVVDTTPCLI